MLTNKHSMAMKLCVLALILVVATTTGCGRKKPVITPDLTGSGTDTGVGRETTTGDGLPSLEQERLFFQKLNQEPIYFDYDSYALRPDALATLQRSAEFIKTQPAIIIQIEGHCDERGTQEYNLALGERRALAVRDHLIRLGISGDRMVTISYGKERPAVEGHNEAAWSKNRRCEFNSARR